MSTEVLTSTERKMARAVEAMERDFQGIRTGRASTSLVERIHVEYYGTQTPLNQLAGISVPEPHQIVIQPWDRSVLGAIEKAIQKSDIGLVPNVELAYLTGCRLGHRPERGGWVPDHDREMQTSVGGVYVVGDGRGVDEDTVSTPRLAMDQGRMAAIAVAEARGTVDRDRALALEQELSALHGRPGATGRGPDPDAWLRSLVLVGGMDVVVCQCEGVTRQELVDVCPPKYLAGSPAGQWETKLPTLR